MFVYCTLRIIFIDFFFFFFFWGGGGAKAIPETVLPLRHRGPLSNILKQGCSGWFSAKESNLWAALGVKVCKLSPICKILAKMVTHITVTGIFETN